MPKVASVIEPVVRPKTGELLPGRKALAGLAVLAGVCSTTTLRVPGLPILPGEIAWLALLVGATLSWLRRGTRELPSLPWLVCATLAVGSCGLLGAPTPVRGVVEWGQLCVQLAVPIAVLGLLPELAGSVALGLALGVGLNALAVTVQRLSGLPPVELAGLLNGRVLLAAVVAALAPVVFRFLIPHRLGRYRPVGLAVAGLTVLAVALPQSAIVVGAFLLLLAVYRPLRTRCPLTAVVLLALLAAVVAIRWGDYREFLRTDDPDGTPRRWVQEAVSSARAIKARPWTGHGFGRYQSVVSSGEYRGELPRPLETKVEPGRQIGYFVLAVEGGVPFAALVGAMLVLAGWQGYRGSSPRHRAAGLACWGLFLMLGTTPLLVRGVGFALGAIVALAVGRRAHGRRAMVQGALLLGCLGLAVGLHSVEEHALPEATAPALPEASSATVLLAAGMPTAMPAWATLGDKQSLSVPDGVLVAGPEYQPAIYPFSLSEPATVVLWLRASWHDGCGNSIAAAFDGAPPRLVGNDGTYHTWHWVRGFEAELTAGQHELGLYPREDGLAVDQILITSDTKAYPQGRLGNGGHSAEDETLQVEPVEPPPLVARASSFRFGIGGCYRGGFKAALLQLGLPWGKVNDYDLEDAEKLKPYNVLCLSELKEVDENRCFPALEQFVRSGGVLIWENDNGSIPRQWQRSETLLPFSIRWRMRYEAGGTQLKTDDSPLFAGIDPGTMIPLHDQVSVARFWGKPGADWRSYGTLVRYGREAGAAFYGRDLDKGKVFFLALPLSFHTMWKGRQFLPVLNNLLAQTAAEACPPLHPALAEERPDREGAWFGDDFMRAGPELGGGWTATGMVRCTGEDHSPERIAFAAEANAPATLAAGHEQWTGYRLSAAVRTAAGTVVLGASTPDGMPAQLVWQAETRQLALRRGDSVLQTVTLPAKGERSWRRLSLYGEGNAWYGFVDGQAALRVETDRRAALCGAFSLQVTEGKAYIDDVAICPVSEVVPGTDRALGEEGSPAAWGGLGQHGIERHTTYSMPWLSRASATYHQAVELALPPYRGGVLYYDDSPGLRVAPSADAATVALPQAPTRWLAMVAPGWRDYEFTGRLTEWTPQGGDWIPLSRWSCDPEWHWVGTETTSRSAIWYNQPLAPPYAVNAVLSLGARLRFGDEYRRGRDLNLQLAGNGQDLDHGLSVRVMNNRDRGIEIWRDGTRIAQAKGVGMPSGHTLHHNWYEVGAWVEPNRVRVRFEGATVLDVPLQPALDSGRLAIWTERNSLRIARVTVADGNGP